MINWQKIPHFFLKGNYKKGHIEGDFQAEILSKLRGLQYICFHPIDLGLTNRFVDVHLIDKQANMGWIELKKIQLDSFNVKQFEEGQIVLLRELEKRDPEAARVWIYSVKNNDYREFKFSELWNAQNKRGGIKIFNKK